MNLLIKKRLYYTILVYQCLHHEFNAHLIQCALFLEACLYNKGNTHLQFHAVVEAVLLLCLINILYNLNTIQKQGKLSVRCTPIMSCLYFFPRF